MSPSSFSADSIEFITVLNAYEVKWVIVGGEAVIYHGHIRLTGDVDFFYRLDEVNVKRLWNALNDFWDNNIPGNLSENDLSEPGRFIQFGVPPNRIDLMNQIDGVGFDEVWENKVVEYIETGQDRIEVNFIGLTQLIKNKTITNRPKDREDLTYLKKKKKMSKKHSEKFEALVDDALTRIPEISAEEVARKLVKKEDFALIDTRETHEFENGHLPKAIHLSKGVIERDIEEKISDYDKELVLYCGGGYRSALAADNLRKMGFSNVKSLAGGWREWNEKKLPTE